MSSLFAGSPLEGHILAVFLRAQTAMATFIRGTPIFRGLLFAALTWVVLHQFLRIATSRHEANHAVITIVYRLGMVFLSIGLMTWDRKDVDFHNIDGKWAQYSAIQSDPRYDLTLRGQNTALWAYTLLHGSIDGVAQESAKAAAVAFGDDSLARDPMFVLKMLDQMSAFTLNENTTTELIQLARDCGNTSTGQIADLGASELEDMLDLSSASCAAKWSAFRADAEANGAELLNRIPHGTLQRLRQATGVGQEQLQRVALNFAMHRTVTDLIDLFPGTAAGAGAPDADGATGETGGTDQRSVQPDVGNAFLRRYAAMTSSTDSAGGAVAWQHLLEQFKHLEPLIPAARAYLEGILAILFVVAVYSIGFGTWRFMTMWLFAEASMCLYQPVALLGYKVTEYFLKVSPLLTATGNNGLLIGGGAALREQIVTIQAIYVAFELGAFMTFCVGAFALFRQLSNVMWAGNSGRVGVDARRGGMESSAGAGSGPGMFTSGRAAPVMSSATVIHTLGSGNHGSAGSPSQPVPGAGLGIQSGEAAPMSGAWSERGDA